MTQEVKKFLDGQKSATHYQIGGKKENRPLERLMKIGALAGAVIFNAACTSLPQQEAEPWVIPGPEVAEVTITDEDRAYSQELTKAEQRMNAYLGADKIKFMKPDAFKKYQGRDDLYGQSLMDFKSKVADLLPQTIDPDRLNGGPVLKAAQAYAKNSPEAHGVYTWTDPEMAACIIIPAKDGDLFKFAPGIDEDLGQQIEMTSQERMVFTNYHEAWHCLENQLYGEVDQSDRKGAYFQVYKSENFGDIGAVVEMIKDGYDAKKIINGIQQSRAFRLLSNPIDMNAEDNMTHYTIPALNALEAYIDKNGVDALKEMTNEETVQFVVDIVENNILDAQTLQAAVGYSISQPKDTEAWAHAYSKEQGITGAAETLKITNAANDMQQSILRQAKMVNPEKASKYQFQKPVSVHVPKIYEDPFQSLFDQIDKIDQSTPKAPKRHSH